MSCFEEFLFLGRAENTRDCHCSVWCGTGHNSITHSPGWHRSTGEGVSLRQEGQRQFLRAYTQPWLARGEELYLIKRYMARGDSICKVTWCHKDAFCAMPSYSSPFLSCPLLLLWQLKSTPWGPKLSQKPFHHQSQFLASCLLRYQLFFKIGDLIISLPCENFLNDFSFFT